LGGVDVVGALVGRPAARIGFGAVRLAEDGVTGDGPTGQ
jgi:hypothetical protein